MGKINFNLDDRKHARFKAKACLEGTDMSTVLTKAVDAFIGKIEIGADIIEKEGNKIKKVELKEISIIKEEDTESLKISKNI